MTVDKVKAKESPYGSFKDYAKAGLPLILIATVVSMVILPIAFPFFPQ